MAKTITVKGIGKASARPNQVVLTMNLKTENEEYDKTVEEASLRIRQLTDAFIAVGFEEKNLKTTDFKVSTNYESENDIRGNYHRVFKGYCIRQDMKLEFDFDQKRLATVIGAVSTCDAKPEFNIRFTVKDADALKDEMLKSATINAKHKAEILCEASGSKLGELAAINYSWGELNIFSNTLYEVEDDDYVSSGELSKLSNCLFEPDDIDASDTVTFIWKID